VDTIKAVVDALHAGWLGMGAITQSFEEGLAAFLELRDRHVLATNTGTSALHLGLLAAGVGEGTGLGLPLAKLLMEAHGGKLELNSEINRGTSVIIHFPPDRVVTPTAAALSASQ
jgi:hypothetical protein